jgi:cytochrome P450
MYQSFEPIIHDIRARTSGTETAKQHRTIFTELLDADIPTKEKSVNRLAEEARVIISAGSITTAHFLTLTIYHILANDDLHQTLQAELDKAKTASSGTLSMQDLEQLPYLNAVIKEGYRLSYGIVSRLPRIAPDTTLHCQGYTIPAGTTVSMTSVIQHMDTSLFPKPERFEPQRWLDADNLYLDRYLVNFSKGTRACLGINLAKAEILLTLATLFTRFDIKLHDTTRADVEVARDYFAAYASAQGRGLRVTLEGK